MSAPDLSVSIEKNNKYINLIERDQVENNNYF